MSSATARTTADVVVVGAGLAGLLCALRLQEAGPAEAVGKGESHLSSPDHGDRVSVRH